MRKINKKNTKSITIKAWLHRLWISFWILFFVCFSLFCIWSWKSGFVQKQFEKGKKEFNTLIENCGFVLNDILIEGRKRTSKTEIKNALNLPVDNLITALDLKKMQENLAHLPWVKSVSVSRQLPNILFIRLEERTPIALWQNNKKYYPIDEDGNIINASCEDNLLLLVGNGAPVKAYHFIQTLKQFKLLYERVVSAVLINDLRWNLYIDDIENGIIILLPDSDLNNALERLENLQKTENVLDKDISKIDLRFTDKTVIKPRHSNAISFSEKGGNK